jgi:hypothetical protein
MRAGSRHRLPGLECSREERCLRRFTAFNLLRILPSTAYVVGVVIVYALNATSLVLFMALWAAVNLIGGSFALAFAVRGLPAARRGGLGAVAGANGEVRAQGHAGNSVASRSVRLAVAFFPKVALGLVITLSAGLFIAFGRGALAEHTRSLQQSVATRRDSPP